MSEEVVAPGLRRYGARAWMDWYAAWSSGRLVGVLVSCLGLGTDVRIYDFPREVLHVVSLHGRKGLLCGSIEGYRRWLLVACR